MEVSGVLLMVMLGLRHGFDPDHIAVIDSVSIRYSITKPALSKWTGTLFAIGHGAVVTSIMVTISRFSHSYNLPKVVWNILDWLPGLILIFLGLMNFRMLLIQKDYSPKGWKTFFIPSRLKNSSHPLSIVLIGVLFAMVFDTNTQAAAWAYTATSKLGATNALILGLSFSVGMITTDTLDSRILFSLVQNSEKDNLILNYRRKLGWIIVIISLLTGLYKLISHINPNAEIPENVLTIIGVTFFALMVLFYIYILYSGSQQTKKLPNGD